MRGDEWGRLVSAPTATEVDAALAGVRVRALGVVRRQARVRRAATLVLVAAALTGGMVAGHRLDSAGAYPSQTLSYEHVAMAAAPVAPGGVFRYRVVSWAELYGERMSVGEAWVEGPAGTRFRLRKQMPPFSYTGVLAVGDSGELTVQSTISRSERTAAGSWRTTEERHQPLRETFRSGALIIRPFGSRPVNDEPVVMLRLEGPFAAPPPPHIRWARPRSIPGVVDPEGFDPNAAVDAGVRFALASSGPLLMDAGYEAPTRRMRFTLGDHPPSPIYTVWGRASRGRGRPGTAVAIPGLRDTAAVLLRAVADRGTLACFEFAVDDHDAYTLWRRRQGPPPFYAEGCFPAANPYAPLVVATWGGQRLTVELIR